MDKTNRKGYYISSEELVEKFHFPCTDKDSRYFFEVTQWENFEGFTISINDSLGARTFELGFEELELINYLKQKMDYE